MPKLDAQESEQRRHDAKVLARQSDAAFVGRIRWFMRPTRIDIAHFRALRNFSISLSPKTILVGGNGAGKSSVPHAIEFFMNPIRTPGEGDVHGEHVGEPVEITVTFTDLLPNEAERFKTYLQPDGTLTLMKRCTTEATKYIAQVPSFPGFTEIRAQTSLAAIRGLWNELVSNSPEYGPKARSADDAIGNMMTWEQSNRHRLVEGEVTVSVVDLKRRELSPETIVRFIPAVQEAKIDAKSPLRSAIEEAIRLPAEARTDLDELRRRTLEAAKALFTSETTPQFTALKERLDIRLAEFSPGTSVGLGWGTLDDRVEISVPEVIVRIFEDGYGGPLEGKGHGLQRGAIFGAMRLEYERLVEASGAGERRHLIVLIEEPELYLHPTRARHVATMIDKITEGGDVSMIYATHSPFFARLADFESIRLIQRRALEGADSPERVVSQTSLDAVAKKLEDAHGVDRGFSGDALRSKIFGLLDATIREGFFARKVVICEGDQDVAIVRAAAKFAGVDLDAHDIAVLPSNGKDALDRPLAIFSLLGLDVYAVFDADGNCANDKREKNAGNNRALFRLLEADPLDFPDENMIRDRYAVWKTEIGKELRESFDDASDFDGALSAAARHYGSEVKPLKNALVVGEALDQLRAANKNSTLIEDLGAKLKAFAGA